MGALKIPRPSKPRIVQPRLTDDDVVAHLAKLSDSERAALLERVSAIVAPRPPIAVRATLKSSDVEDAVAPRPSTPPPLPARALPKIIVAPDPPPQAVSPPVPATPPPAPPSSPPSTLPSTLPPVSAIVARRSEPDATEVLFEAMHELDLFDSSAHAAAHCLATAIRVVPSLAGLVHLYDAKARTFVTVYGHGPRAERRVLERVAAEDALIARAARDKGPIVVDYPDAGVPAERHAFFGDPWSVLVAPIVAGGVVLGAIELVDPRDGAPFDERAKDAVCYVADRFAEFVKERGIDVSRVVRVE